MNQTESIKAYLEEKASKHKIAYTEIEKYQELIEGYFAFKDMKKRSCFTCKFAEIESTLAPCKYCLIGSNYPNWQKA